ncbi:MAG: enoyl-CoA hydratase/isomerase family protein [Bdellovibrionales bacterium]|nr:enoyl-CoA hydratase/isomerase family protein [Bdellovibrionales bacterium]
MSSIIYKEENEIATITLSRPEKRNAFGPEMIEELTAAFTRAEKGHCRLLVIKGEGKSFSAGADLEWMKSMVGYSFEENKADSEKLFEMFYAGRSCSLPIIALVQGHVMGGALGLLAICDYVLCEENTKLAFSEVRIGLAPAVISPFVLEKGYGGRLKEWMLSGKVFSAKEAKKAGLVTEVGTFKELEMSLSELIVHFQTLAPVAVRETKRLIRAIAEIPSFTQTKQMTTQVISERRVSEEGQEGLASFFEKRKPTWNLGE